MRYEPIPNSLNEEIRKLAAMARAKTPISSGVSSRAIMIEPTNNSPNCPNCWLKDQARDLSVLKGQP